MRLEALVWLSNGSLFVGHIQHTCTLLGRLRALPLKAANVRRMEVSQKPVLKISILVGTTWYSDG